MSPEILAYIAELRRSWKTVFLAVLVPVIAALLVSLLLPKSYTSQADLILFRSRVDVSFEPSLQTVSEDEFLNFNNAQDPRRQTVATLAMSADVFQQTLEAMPADLQAHWSIDMLRENATVDVIGNVLQLAMQADSPAEAALVANTWAGTTTNLVNSAFREPETGTLLGQQVADAAATYDQAQSELEAFVGQNQIEALTLEVEFATRALQNIQATYQENAQNTLETTLSARDRLPLLLASADALQAMLAERDSDEPVQESTRLVLLYLETGALSTGVELPGELQIALENNPENPLTVTMAQAWLDQFTQSLHSLDEQISVQIETQSTAFLAEFPQKGAIDAAAQNLLAEINRLQAELEHENARLRELQTTRDLAWDNFQALRRQAAEEAIAEQTAETEVVIAANALPPEKPSAPSLIINLAVALVVGLALGMALPYLLMLYRQST